MNRNNRTFDALIVGGGVAGAATAIALARSGWRVAILHRRDDREGLETISPQAARFLDDQSLQLGVPLESVTACWGSAEPVKRYYPGSRIISRLELATALRERANSARAEQFEILRHLRLARTADGWLAQFSSTNGEHLTISAQYAVDASGSASFLGKQNGSQRHASDELWSVTATLRQPDLIGSFTESTKGGWWNLCSDKGLGTLSFFGQRATAEDVRQRFLEQFRRTTHLQQLVQSQAGPIRLSLCSSSELQPCAGERWIAVGDAAFSVHPLASAGIAHTLRDAGLAAQSLRKDPADYAAFQRREYERYLSQLRQQYSSENRWPQSPFWQSMHGKGDRVNVFVL